MALPDIFNPDCRSALPRSYVATGILRNRVQFGIYGTLRRCSVFSMDLPAGLGIRMW